MGKEQVILGVNGFSRRTHDASACITIGGDLVAMAEEERFTRRKNAFGQLPHNAIAYCLDKADIPVDEIDTLAIGWDFNNIFENMGKEAPTKDELLNLYLPSDRFSLSKRPPIEMVPHHLAHASSAYYLSGFDNSAILVTDGQGENQSTSLFKGVGDRITPIQEFRVEDSLGYFYEAISEYVGVSRLNAGKTMGLASYGNPRFLFDLISLNPNGYSVDIQGQLQVEMDLQQEITKVWKDYLESSYGAPNTEAWLYDSERGGFRRQTEFPDRYKDIAASAQKALEMVAKHLVNIMTEGQPSNVCIAGGVGLNCSMNGVVAREQMVKDLFVPPFANDAGVSVGAALYISEKKPKDRLRSASMGPEFSDSNINSTLRELGIPFESCEDISRKTAGLLEQGNIVNWFQGRMEAGPRALGNRSILGNPTKNDTHFRLNTMKNREQWRPLAPSILEASLAEYMQDPSDSPFMLKAFKVRPDAAEKIPAAVHIDGTSRAQTVTSEANPLYFNLIKEFELLTGVPVVMNTSFNLEYEPIVCSPTDAIRTFYSSGANYMALGNVLISKKQ